MTAGSAIWRGQFFEVLFELVELLGELHVDDFGLGDHEFAALLSSSAMAPSRALDGYGGLVVGRRLGGDALHPRPGAVSSGQERAAAFGGEADQLVAEAR